MTFIETLQQRNDAFAANGFSANLKIIPSTKTLIIGCLDPRVDPMDVLGLKPGEAAIIRNIGGRINPALVETMILLPVVTKAAGQDMGPGWNLIILHHTDCGIKGCYKFAPDLLASHLGVSREELDLMAITDPHKAVAMDIAAYRANTAIPGGYMVSGLVYDVLTGKIEVVVQPCLLREAVES
ncbi:carbonic anhydrase [Granulicella aggregans]|uniref:Carbonic anhydrase n=1 Tax=Granulicella aggregans TaxID=474949 RepID=A0A7W8E521_9BACT|nr:carbonic anhydrase [Granulicella aggregans]MBB5059643.1 carbonic anhydrase [Granulicella aggregans]